MLLNNEVLIQHRSNSVNLPCTFSRSWHYVLSLGILALSVSRSASAAEYIKFDTAKVFSLLAFSQKEIITSCSATLIKDENNVCHLITDYHCVRDGASSYKISGTPGVDDPQNPHLKEALATRVLQPLAVKVIKQDPGEDLAELSIPLNSEVQSQCDEISSAINYLYLQYQRQDEFGYGGDIGNFRSDLDVNQLPVVSAESIGFGPSGLQYFLSGQHFEGQNNGSRDLDWVDMVRPALSNRFLAFFELGGLQVKRGMSGGIVITTPSFGGRPGLVGIVDRLIDLQQTSYVIPIRQVERFLKNAILFYKETDAQKLLYDHLDQCADAGDNEHAGVGDNEHAGVGEDCGSSSFGSLKELPVQFPDEGYLLPNSHTRVLAVNELPINGFDDYYNSLEYWKQKQPGSTPSIKSRGPDGFPDFTDRINILDRLSGKFMFNFADPPDHANSGGYEVFTFDAEGSAVFKSRAANPRYQISIAKLKQGVAQIKLSGDFYNWNRGAPEYLQGTLEAIQLTGTLRLSDDAKTISITFSDGNTSTCVNNDYQKIVCKGPAYTFSFGRVLDSFWPWMRVFEFKMIQNTQMTGNGKRESLVHYY